MHLAFATNLIVGIFLAVSPPKITRANNPLRGTIESLRYQNQKIDELGIERVGTKKDIERFLREKKLVPVPEAGVGYYIDRSVPKWRRALTQEPDARGYLTCLAGKYHSEFNKRLKIFLELNLI